MRIALEPFLHLQCQALHSAPHVGMAGRDPHPNAGCKRNHRAANALITAAANALITAAANAAGGPAPIRTRTSRPSSIVTAGTSVCDGSLGSAATTTLAN